MASGDHSDLAGRASATPSRTPRYTKAAALSDGRGPLTGGPPHDRPRAPGPGGRCGRDRARGSGGAGTFPTAIHLGGRSVGWLAEEIEAWIAICVAESRTARTTADRAMNASEANENGHPPDAIERQLAHVESNRVRATYSKAMMLEERRPGLAGQSEIDGAPLGQRPWLASREYSRRAGGSAKR